MGEPGAEFDGVFDRFAQGRQPDAADGGFLRERMAVLAPGRIEAFEARSTDGSHAWEVRHQWDEAFVDAYANRPVLEASAAFARRSRAGDHLRVGWVERQPDDAGGDARIREMLPFIESEHIRNTGAHRLLARLAARADVDGFLAERRRWDRGRRRELAQLGTELVRAVARTRGVEDASALADRPGTRTDPEVVVAAVVSQMTVAQVEDWFDSHPELDVDNRRLDAVVEAFCRAPAENEAIRADLIEQVATSSRERDKAVRDWQLVHLASRGYPTSKRLITRARAAIRAPQLKKELSGYLQQLTDDGRLTD